jgi:hypothetical protein
MNILTTTSTLVINYPWVEFFSDGTWPDGLVARQAMRGPKSTFPLVQPGGRRFAMKGIP